MDITFEEYDKIVKRVKENGFCIEDFDLSKIQDIERILGKEHSIEFLICLLELGDFSNNLGLKKQINKILMKELNFIG